MQGAQQPGSPPSHMEELSSEALDAREVRAPLVSLLLRWLLAGELPPPSSDASWDGAASAVRRCRRKHSIHVCKSRSFRPPGGGLRTSAGPGGASCPAALVAPSAAAGAAGDVESDGAAACTERWPWCFRHATSLRAHGAGLGLRRRQQGKASPRQHGRGCTQRISQALTCRACCRDASMLQAPSCIGVRT